MVTHDKNQQVKAYISVVRDITERKRAEEALRLSEERLKAIIEQSPLSIQFFSPDGICTGVNPAWEKLWGMQSEKIMGYNVLADPQIKEKGILPHLQKTFAGEVGSVPPTYYDPAEVGLVGEARWTTAVAYPVKDSSGQVREVVLTHQDVTERIQSEEKVRKLNEELEQRVNERTLALSEAHNLLQTLMDNMPDHIYFKDMKSRFIRNSRSQARMMGMNDPTEVIGKTDFDFFPPAHAQRSYDEEQDLIKSGQPIIDLEERVVWPNGRITWVSTTKLPWRDAEGEITGMFGISRDITERKQAEEELQNSNLQLDAANKELEAFSYSVSHDLRAPLRSIDGFSQALLEDYGNQIPEQGRQYLNRVRNAAQHMAELIDDLLNLSRVTRTPMKSETVDLSALAEKITNDLQHTEPERQATISITPGLTAKGDAQLLYIVLMNLLGNAWKFTSKKEDPRIEFGTEADTDLTTFFVRDNGAGFDMTYADKLFGAFQRLHSMEEFPGTGIGLATVKRIISRHGGKVWAESESGTGTTFYFTL
jgi:PAS domain S-box-containing protein